MTVQPHILAFQMGSRNANSTVQITNQNTGETQTATADSSGNVVFDAANFVLGYDNGDRITAIAPRADTDFRFFITSNGDATYPSWIECENTIRTQIPANAIRFKIDTTTSPSGITLALTETSA